MTMTWWTALAGGVLIGLSATLLLWLNGRVAGVSGIIGGVVFRVRGDVAWRAAFLVGLVLAAGLYMALVPGAPQPRARFPPLALVAAGLLFGFCTSWGQRLIHRHRSCGLTRF